MNVDSISICLRLAVSALRLIAIQTGTSVISVDSVPDECAQLSLLMLGIVETLGPPCLC